MIGGLGSPTCLQFGGVSSALCLGNFVILAATNGMGLSTLTYNKQTFQRLESHVKMPVWFPLMGAYLAG